MYHYVRDLPNTRFPRIKGLMLDEFRQPGPRAGIAFRDGDAADALEFLSGTYSPAARDLCILTFDDGLKEHYSDVAPILSEQNIQGLFGVITLCVHDHLVAPVHMNHFLMAELGFEPYSSVFLTRLRDEYPKAFIAAQVDPNEAQRSYPLDTRDVAAFKFLFNFTLDAAVRDRIVEQLFETYLGDQDSFARELYMTWDEVRQLQRAGMLVAGHTHWHRPLSTLTDDQLNIDLSVSRSLFDQNLRSAGYMAVQLSVREAEFVFGNGSRDAEATRIYLRLGTEDGPNTGQTPLFELRRVDCNCVKQLQS